MKIYFKNGTAYIKQVTTEIYQPNIQSSIRVYNRNRSMSDQYMLVIFNPYPTAFPYGNGMVLHFYQQQESSTTKTVHKVINKGLKAYV